jgi:hypothetical protein
VRDTVRVAVSDLGPGTFTNNGTLALVQVTGATTLDNTGCISRSDKPATQWRSMARYTAN